MLQGEKKNLAISDSFPKVIQNEKIWSDEFVGKQVTLYYDLQL